MSAQDVEKDEDSDGESCEEGSDDEAASDPESDCNSPGQVMSLYMALCQRHSKRRFGMPSMWPNML